VIAPKNYLRRWSQSSESWILVPKSAKHMSKPTKVRTAILSKIHSRWHPDFVRRAHPWRIRVSSDVVYLGAGANYSTGFFSTTSKIKLRLSFLTQCRRVLSTRGVLSTGGTLSTTGVLANKGVFSDRGVLRDRGVLIEGSCLTEGSFPIQGYTSALSTGGVLSTEGDLSTRGFLSNRWCKYGIRDKYLLSTGHELLALNEICRTVHNVFVR